MLSPQPHQCFSCQPLALRAACASLLFALPAMAQGDGLAGQLGKGQSDFGGVGLMQTPTARMAPMGNMSVNLNRTSPYRRYSVFFQPTDWFEGGFRYVEVENRRFGVFDDDRPYLDKGFDAKFRLLEETRYWPEVALGLRDFGGTTLFGAEYLAASKRWYDLDITLGLGWGYLGNASDIDNPLGWLGDRFEQRPTSAGGDQGGEFAVDQLFAGPAAFFGGIEYQTPWNPLVLQLEAEGNGYRNEPLNNDLEQDSRWNIGARLALTDNLEARAGWQRGNTLMAGVSYHIDLAGLSQPKNDPSPQPIDAPAQPDWQQASDLLERNAGMDVHRISQRHQNLYIQASPDTYRSLSKSEGRAGRILHAQADDSVDTFRFQWQERGLPLRENIHDRDAFADAARSADNTYAHQYGIYSQATLSQSASAGHTVYHEPPAHGFDWNLSPSLDQNFGGPDGYLYRLKLMLDAQYETDANGWFSGNLALTLADNLDNYEYIADSDLPRVRTFIGDYLNDTRLGIEHLQYTRTAALGDNTYGMAYAGLLEMMYAGAGGEVLYRPLDAPYAFGVEANWVRQRGFDQDFSLRDYSTWTGYLNAYLNTGIEDVLAKISVGRYLAKDVGGTLDLSREFDSGVRIGAWGTWTDAGDDFGEGGFDKGLYLSIPFDGFFTTSSRDRADISWQPLTRDGGARLDRRYDLYDLTQERSHKDYWKNYPDTWR